MTSTIDVHKLNFNRANYQAKLCQHDIVVNVGLPCPKSGMLLIRAWSLESGLLCLLWHQPVLS